MPRGTYQVQMQEPMNGGVGMGCGVGNVEVAKQAQRDTSYKTCIQAMIIFVLMCLILILASWVPWGSVFGRNKNDRIKSAQSLNGNQTSSAIGQQETSLPLEPTLFAVPETTTISPETIATTTATVPKKSTQATKYRVKTTTIQTTTTEEYNVARQPSYTVIPEYPPSDENETETNTLTTTTRVSTRSGRVYLPKSSTYPSTTTEDDNRATSTATSTLSEDGGRPTDQDDTDATDSSESSTQQATALHEETITTVSDVENIHQLSEETSTMKQTEHNTDSSATTDEDIVHTESVSNEERNESYTSSTVPSDSTTDSSISSEDRDDNNNTSTVESVSGNTDNTPTTDLISTTLDDFTSSSIIPTEDSTNSTDYQGDDTSDSSSMKPTEDGSDLLSSVNEDSNTVMSTTSIVTETESISSDQESQQEQGKLENLQEDTSTPDSEFAEIEATCKTNTCKALASKMLSLVNHSTDPCENFYQYTCGGLLTNKALKEELASDDVFDRIRAHMMKINESSSEANQKFRNYYDSCLTYSRVSHKTRRTVARQFLDEIGKFHTKESWQLVKANVTDLLLRLMLRHSTPLMDIVLDVDVRHTDRFALRLTPPIFKSIFGSDKKKREECQTAVDKEDDLNDMYLKYVNCTKNYESYLDETEDAIKFFGVFDGFKNKSRVGAIILETRQTIDWHVFGDMLGKLPSTGELRHLTISKTFESMTIRELQDAYSILDWQVLISSLLQRSTPLPEHTDVQVYNKQYFEEMFKHIQGMDSRILNNALLAMYAHDLYVDLAVTPEECARETYCLQVASELMEDVASSLYLASFKRDALDAMRRDAQDVFSRLRDAMRQRFIDASWMDEASRTDAVAKLNVMKLEVDGGAHMFLNDTFLDERMQEIDINESDYLNLSVSLSARYRRLMYSLYDVQPGNTEALWTQFLLPTSSNGIVIYRLNTIVIPYSHVWSLYEEQLPLYVKMARLGFSIAHELAHHFDSVGINYRPGGGNDYSIISDDSKPSFEEFTYDVGSKYSFLKSYTTVDQRTVQYKLNPYLLLNERIADDAGAALSLAAYKTWATRAEMRLTLPWLDTDITDEQLYFIAMSQNFCSKSSIFDDFVAMFEGEHLPSFLRVNDIMSNSVDFSSAFKCPVGSEMNPVTKCDVFPTLTKLDSNNQGLVAPQ